MTIKTQRAYETDRQEAGYRILVDRLWPRGIKKEKLALDEWAKELAPSNELRKWFHRDLSQWDEFQKRYKKELEAQSEEIERIRRISRERDVILIYGAKDKERNQTLVLKEVIGS